MLTLTLRGTQLHLRSPGVVAIGAPLVDLVCHVEEAFIQKIQATKGSSVPVDESLLSLIVGQLRQSMKRSVGGSALNVAFALARLSGRVAFIGKIGIDYEGWLCRREMKEAGIVSWISVDQNRPTGKVLCLVTPDAERTMLAHPGASSEMNVEELSGLEMHSMGIAHFEGYQVANFDFCSRVMAKAKGQGALVSLDLASVTWVELHLQSFRFLIANLVNILFGNYEEMCLLTGMHEPEEICRNLGTLVDTVILTRGDQGVWCWLQGDLHYFPVTPVQPLDTTGAGDLFCAGILHAMRWSWPLDKGIELATMLAREVILVDGAKLSESAWQRVMDHFPQLLSTQIERTASEGDLPQGEEGSLKGDFQESLQQPLQENDAVSIASVSPDTAARTHSRGGAS